MVVRHWIIMLIAPLFSAGLLLGMWRETARHITPGDVEPFHARAKAAIDSYPVRVGEWVGTDAPQPTEAIKLLRPNCILSRKYQSTSERNHYPVLNLLFVQCKDSRDMQGHYPPNCYPANGYEKLSQQPRDWQVGDLSIGGMEYEFELRNAQQSYRMVVYNFLIVPGRGIARDMGAVNAAAEDYQERYYGAAQFQMVISAEVPRAERDRIFAQLIGARPDIIRTLSSGGIHER